MSEGSKIFAKDCFCKKESVNFSCRPEFNENAITNLYCPECSEQASNGALLVKITAIPGMIGIWGIDFNKEVLKKIDPDFKDDEDYLENVFEKKCSFEKIPKRTSQAFYEILGIKSNLKHHKGEDTLSGPDRKMIQKGGKPTKLPKDVRSGPEESYRPFSGYKGHH